MCSICRTHLARDKKSVNATFPLGEQAHIVAESESGPRGKSLLLADERNSYHNLILLCPTHHTEIDKNEADYPVEKLHILKSRHELWVRDSLKVEPVESNDELQPVTQLIEFVHKIEPLLIWVNKPVPAKKAQPFLEDLHQCWSDWFCMSTDSTSRSLFGSIDYLLRPMSTGYILKTSEQHYCKSKFLAAIKHFHKSFQLGLPQRYESEFWEFSDFMEISDILWSFQKDLQQLNKNSNLYSQIEKDLLLLAEHIAIYSLSVYKAGRYLDIPDSFVRQSLAIVEHFLRDMPSYTLPSATDYEESENLVVLINSYRK